MKWQMFAISYSTIEILVIILVLLQSYLFDFDRAYGQDLAAFQ